MDENKNYKDPEREGDDNDTYDPYEEYVKDKRFVYPSEKTM